MTSTPRLVRAAGAIAAAVALSAGGLSACADDSAQGSAPAVSTQALPSNPATGSPMKVGFITPEGGAVALSMVREGGEAAASYLNANGGGVGGHSVDLVVCKQQEEPASATRCANQMVEQKVSVVISPLGAQGSVMVPIVTRAGIPYVAQAPVSQVEMVTPNTFMLSGGIVSVLSGQAATAARDGVKSVTMLIGDSGDAATAVKTLGTPIFRQAGVTLDVVTIPVSVADPTPQITAALQTDPGAVAILADTRQCISTLKALQAAAPGVQKYLVASCLDKNVVTAVGAQTVAGAKAFTTVNLSSQDPSVNLYRSVMARYAPTTDPAGLAYLGYQTVMSLAEVGKGLTGDVTPATVATAIAGATGAPLPAAPGITFTCDGSAFPRLRALCSKSVLVSTVGQDTRFTDTTVVNN